MLAQIKTLTPAEQAALAGKYGIEIPQSGGAGSKGIEDMLGGRGEEIELFDRVQQLQLESEMRRKFAEDVGQSDEELERFDAATLFDNEISTFSPVDDMPAPDGYRVGPGDSINLYLYGNEEVDAALSVNREGQLILPRLGPLSISD